MVLKYLLEMKLNTVNFPSTYLRDEITTEVKE